MVSPFHCGGANFIFDNCIFLLLSFSSCNCANPMADLRVVSRNILTFNSNVGPLHEGYGKRDPPIPLESLSFQMTRGCGLVGMVAFYGR